VTRCLPLFRYNGLACVALPPVAIELAQLAMLVKAGKYPAEYAPSSDKLLAFLPIPTGTWTLVEPPPPPLDFPI